MKAYRNIVMITGFLINTNNIMNKLTISIVFTIIYTLIYKFAGIEVAVCTGIGQIIANQITRDDTN